MIVSKNNPWSQLRSVVLGNYYHAEHFAWIPEAAVREPLMRMADEIHQDLDAFDTLLRSFGCEVIRPEVMTVSAFQEHYALRHSLPNAPLQPRNTHMAVYDDLYCVNPDPAVSQALRAVPQQDITEMVQAIFRDSQDRNRDCHDTEHGIWYSRGKYSELAGPDWPNFEGFVQGLRGATTDVQQELAQFENSLRYDNREWLPLQPPNVIPLPDRLVLDTNEYTDYSSIFQHQTNIKIEHINTGAGHTDGCFVILGNHTIIGIDPLIDYAKHFPDHVVIPVPAAVYGDVIQQRKAAALQRPSWWLPDHGNQALTRFVDRYMQDYTGSVWETLFDVNVLSINENTVCVTNDNADIRQALRQRSIDTVLVPWRHRFFVDGGLHCITLDLHRDPI